MKNAANQKAGKHMYILWYSRGFINSGLPTLLIELAIKLNKISRWAIVKKITIKQRMDFAPDTFRMATSKTLLFQ